MTVPGFEKCEIGVGVVTGIRRWTVTPDGRLRGMSVPEIWRPGENVAVCGGNPEFKDDDHIGASLMTPRDMKEPLDCGKCGYYAYFGDRSQFASGSAGIDGVIEGYGYVEIGTKGFRAQKARIVALHASIGAVWVNAYYYGFRGQVAWPVSAHTPLAQPRHGELLAAIRDHYPDVPIYDTAEEMLEAHPTDPMPEADPDREYDVIIVNCSCFLCNVRARASKEPWKPDDDPLKSAKDAALEARKNRSTGPAKPRPGHRKAD